MDMLVVVGTSVSYFYSTLSLMLVCVSPENDGGIGGAGGNPGRPHLFLESPAMLLTFIVLGENRTGGGTIRDGTVRVETGWTWLDMMWNGIRRRRKSLTVRIVKIRFWNGTK